MTASSLSGRSASRPHLPCHAVRFDLAGEKAHFTEVHTEIYGEFFALLVVIEWKSASTMTAS